MSEFIQTLKQEIESSRRYTTIEDQIYSLYFGGGTPSLLSLKEVEDIMTSVRENFKVSSQAEVTFEMNPDDVSADYLSGLSRIGINRISMGVQTFNPERLKFMNRAHSREEALRCLELLQLSPIKSFNVDLIYGNPGQDIEDLSIDVHTLLRFNPPHISAYSLTIEPRTRLGTLNKKGLLKVADDDTVAHHIDFLVDTLSEQGIERYEVSNYSRHGYEARHNSAYWNHINYLGFGPGAHSFLWDEDHRGARRWKNRAHLKTYLSDDAKIDDLSMEKLNLLNLAEERMMMGLRTRDGISLEELASKYDYSLSELQDSRLKKFTSEGYVQINGIISLTDKGMKVADSIITNLL